MTTKLLLASLRLYFEALARLAPKTAGRHAYRLFSSPRKRGTVPSGVEGVMDRAERFEVTVRGQRVAAFRWVAPIDALDSPVGRPRVLLAHGWESRAARLAVWVEPLLAAGFEVVAYDGPAHGESEGRQADPLIFVETMAAVLERVGPAVACVGHSLGGYASILGACGGGPLELEALGFERLVILGGAESGVDAMAMFCEILGLGEGFLPLLLTGAAEAAGHPIADFDLHHHFPSHPVPTLWFHAPEDPQVPFEAAQKVARRCPHVRLETRPGLGHHTIARNPAVVAEAIEFLTAPAPQVS